MLEKIKSSQTFKHIEHGLSLLSDYYYDLVELQIEIQGNVLNNATSLYATNARLASDLKDTLVDIKDSIKK